MNVWTVRAALLLLPEDPPFGLGGCELAREMLPGVTDKLERGRLLRSALRTAIADLGSMRGEWSYLIYVKEYEEGMTRQEVRARLVISESTYTRAKLLGLHWIMDELPYLLPHERAVGEN